MHLHSIDTFYLQYVLTSEPLTVKLKIINTKLGTLARALKRFLEIQNQDQIMKDISLILLTDLMIIQSKDAAYLQRRMI